MYRHSAQVKCVHRNALPSPENTSDSESEIVDILEQKRRQLDEEVAKFKAAKDREFRDFEKDLRSRRRSRGSCETSPTKSSSSSTTNSAVLNLLGSVQNGSTNGWAGRKQKRSSGDGVGDKITKSMPLSKPTLSLDKLNITGDLPSVHSLGTPPTPSFLPKRSPSHGPATSTPPRPENKQQPPTPGTDRTRTDAFAGVFTPAYLPLLDSRDQTPVLARSPQPLTPNEEEEKRLQLDADTKKEAERQKAKLQSSQSLPPQPVSPTVVATKRTNSDPQIPSTSLPSALRTSSAGHGYKKKHVTFQLSDSKVVEPSSSYEESPGGSGFSPTKDLRFRQTVEDVDAEVQVQQVEDKDKDTSPEGKGRRRKTLRERRRGKNGKFLSPMPSPLPSPAPSPTINGDNILLASPEESGFTGGLVASEDGGSGVGFFELDEELASPGIREKAFETEMEAGTLEDVDLNEKVEKDKDSSELQSGSFAAGSVPINIVRPSGLMTPSWVGSFGH
ncbi:hypothetical protein EDD36DRAFT_294740 [Exophiala viscosa]|uniref:Uncharacterized protein n=1 Tax=Exophiala viscosa TaxID=2486360 RepID=A0AAN6DSB5_9EURO|nr:hypothetical protein EDD36DRAFT_294740 [Exophiala viscosa]